MSEFEKLSDIVKSYLISDIATSEYLPEISVFTLLCSANYESTTAGEAFIKKTADFILEVFLRSEFDENDSLEDLAKLALDEIEEIEDALMECTCTFKEYMLSSYMEELKLEYAKSCEEMMILSDIQGDIYFGHWREVLSALSHYGENTLKDVDRIYESAAQNYIED